MIPIQIDDDHQSTADMHCSVGWCNIAYIIARLLVGGANYSHCLAMPQLQLCQGSWLGKWGLRFASAQLDDFTLADK